MKAIVLTNIVRRRPVNRSRAFTLIELLVVISIIGLLAAFTLTVMSGVQRKKYLNNAQAEMALIETALESYKSVYGFYPPSGTNILYTPLYFELQGVTNAGGTMYTTLDGMNSVADTATLANLGVGGFVNCSKGTGQDGIIARNFLPDLKPAQIGIVTNPAGTLVNVAILTSAVGGPDLKYQPLGIPGLNPWRYNSANPTNNPGAYDLYIQLVIGGKTNLVCNWSKAVAIGSPLP